MEANKEGAKVLKDRILRLVRVIATLTEGSENILPDLQRSMDRLIGYVLRFCMTSGS